MNKTAAIAVLLLLLKVPFGLAAGLDFAPLFVDRAAIERVYHEHRTGTKPPFEEAMPPALLARLVREDAKKEAVLARTYGVTITDLMVAAEVERINTTTRAPEMLAEIKAALGNDPARFARAMARPIVVERLLHDKFQNDDALHAPQRRTVEQVRTQLTNAVAAFRNRRGNEAQTSSSQPATLNSQPNDQSLTSTLRSTATEDGSAATNDLVPKLLALFKQTHSNDVSETVWQLGARPADTNAPAADEIEIKKRFGPNAQVLSSPRDANEERKFYFQDLPEELQRVLRVQLRQPGDVSAVIETPGGFLLYLAKEKTGETLSVATLSIPKRSYDQWLNEPNESKP